MVYNVKIVFFLLQSDSSVLHSKIWRPYGFLHKYSGLSKLGAFSKHIFMDRGLGMKGGREIISLIDTPARSLKTYKDLFNCEMKFRLVQLSNRNISPKWFFSIVDRRIF